MDVDRELIIEECKEMYNDMIEICKEWEFALMDGLDKDERWEEFKDER